MPGRFCSAITPEMLTITPFARNAPSEALAKKIGTNVFVMNKSSMVSMLSSSTAPKATTPTALRTTSR